MRMLNKERLIKDIIIVLYIILISILFIFSLGMKAEGPDDPVFAAILSGAYGEAANREPVYLNVLFGRIIKALYLVSNSIPWYYVVQLVLSITAISAFFIVLNREISFQYTIVLLVIMTYGVFREHFYSFQWTKNAYLYISIGIFLNIYGIFKEVGWIKVISVFYICIGFVIRSDCMFALLPVWIIILFGGYIRKRIFSKGIAWAIIIGIAVAILYGYDYKVKNSDEWLSCTERLGILNQSQDYAIPEYEHNTNWYKELGYSENDYQMILRWFVADKEVFSNDKLEQFGIYNNNAIIGRAVSKQNIMGYICHLIDDIKTYPVVVTSLLLCFCAIFFVKNKVELLILYSILAFEDFFLYTKGRAIFRAEYGLFLMAIIIVFTSYILYKDERELNKTVIYRIAIIMGVISCVGHIPSIRKDYQNYSLHYKEPECSRLFEYTSSSDTCYFMNVSAFFPELITKYSWRTVLPENYFDNMLVTGSFLSCTPYDQRIRDRYGIEDPFEAIANGKEVYYISLAPEKENFEMIEKYIYEHYGENMDEVIEDVIDDYYYVYKFVSRKK